MSGVGLSVVEEPQPAIKERTHEATRRVVMARIMLKTRRAGKKGSRAATTRGGETDPGRDQARWYTSVASAKATAYVYTATTTGQRSERVSRRIAASVLMHWHAITKKAISASAVPDP